ncbi:MAG: hypothetical protein EGQ34_03765 [Sutterella sp.]|nr:hypothetical protein [Sutterella sp.]
MKSCRCLSIRNKVNGALTEGDVDVEDLAGDVGKAAEAATAIHRANRHRDAASAKTILIIAAPRQ